MHNTLLTFYLTAYMCVGLGSIKCVVNMLLWNKSHIHHHNYYAEYNYASKKEAIETTMTVISITEISEMLKMMEANVALSLPYLSMLKKPDTDCFLVLGEKDLGKAKQ